MHKTINKISSVAVKKATGMKTLNNIIISQSALIKKGDKYLFLQRSTTHKHGPNKWDLQPLFTTSFTLDNYFVFVVVYLTVQLNGNVKLSKGHKHFRWINKSEYKKKIPYFG